MSKNIAMKLAKEGVLAVLAAAWIVGLIHQFESWSMMAAYLAISLLMFAVTFGDRLVRKFATRQDHRR